MATSSSLATLDSLDLSSISGGMRYAPTDCQSPNVEDRRPGASNAPPPKDCTTSINPDFKMPPQQPLPVPSLPPRR